MGDVYHAMVRMWSTGDLDGNAVTQRAFHICGFCTVNDITEPDLVKARQRAEDLWLEAWLEAKCIMRDDA